MLRTNERRKKKVKSIFFISIFRVSNQKGEILARHAYGGGGRVTGESTAVWRGTAGVRRVR